MFGRNQGKQAKRLPFCANGRRFELPDMWQFYPSTLPNVFVLIETVCHILVCFSELHLQKYSLKAM